MVYERVKKLAEERGISIYALEKEAGLANGTISKWRTSSPTAENLRAVANVLGVAIDDLVDGTGRQGKA